MSECASKLTHKECAKNDSRRDESIMEIRPKGACVCAYAYAYAILCVVVCLYACVCVGV